jgi:RHS repeat-associated protein
MLNKSTGRYAFEITDHLGNVRAVVAKEISSTLAEVLSYTDYYPHGGVLPGRNFVSSPAYKLGYQGQEKDGETNFYNFELRAFDPRLGRWFNPDPMGQYYSPYLAMGNNPVSAIDPTGGYSIHDYDGFIGGDWSSVGNLYEWNHMNPHDRAAMQSYYGTGNTYDMFVVHDGAGGQSKHMTAQGAADDFNATFKGSGIEASYRPDDKIFQYTETRYSNLVQKGTFWTRSTGDISSSEAEALQYDSDGAGWTMGATGKQYFADYTFTGKEKEEKSRNSWLKDPKFKSNGNITPSYIVEDFVIGGVVAKGAITGAKRLIGGVAVVEAGTTSNTLIHYTSEAGYNSIMETGELLPSIGEIGAKNARHGSGQYLTDIVAGDFRRGQVSKRLFGVPWVKTRLTHYIEVEISGLNVIKNGPHNFMIPGTGSISIGGRIVNGGVSVFKIP